MAKTIRPIRCPQCGSPDKSTLGSDLFRCNACQTEYYLDSDDITVHVRHHYAAPPVAPPARRPPLSWGQRVGIGLCGLVAVGAITWLVVLLTRSAQPFQAAIPVAKPTFYLTNFVYADARRQPVYVTIRTDAPRWGSDSTTWTAVFFDARTGRLRREQELLPLGRHPDEHLFSWHTFPNGHVYVLHDQATLYRIDPRTDQLTDVSQRLLANQPAASSGVAQFAFDTDHEALRVLTNEGQTLYYRPTTGQLFTNGEALYRAADRQQPPQFFYFEQASGDFQAASRSRLIRSRAAGELGRFDTVAVAPGRRYFDARVLYQDATTLLVLTATTPRREGPHLLQRLSVPDDRILWSHPAKSYDFQEVVRIADGFALHYRGGPDYAHGALLLANDGHEIRDFQRKRME
ncbi:DUF4394 domain-containing protein [Hymenobacter sp. GOD-10R]|uniref:DUF4394 domain-containing protein n=1 Tax=Hymenobacter sp. GOD-10R TaxID=3093922 RepID=UPI002D771BA7|nr:DUF4394 domain-containing protein [Hymenobacter sp. GOD-10R]WRQ31146.1 DUF4394 domain-containing protein [Hymenobacter sp. GOD-10R]